MKRRTLIVLILVIAIAALLGSYRAGLKVGAERAKSYDAVATGAVTAAALTLLEAGHPDNAKRLLEAAVDDGLVGWSKLTASHALFSEFLSGSGLPPIDDERFVRRLAQYRKAHPSPWTVPPGADAVAQVDPALHWQPLKDRDATIAKVIARYAP